MTNKNDEGKPSVFTDEENKELNESFKNSVPKLDNELSELDLALLPTKASRIEILKDLFPGPKTLLLLALVLGLVLLKIFCLPKDLEPVVFVPNDMKEQRTFLIRQECANALYIAEGKWQVGHNTVDIETNPDIADEVEKCLNRAGFVTKTPLTGSTITIIMKPNSFFDLIRGYFQGNK